MRYFFFIKALHRFAIFASQENFYLYRSLQFSRQSLVVYYPTCEEPVGPISELPLDEQYPDLLLNGLLHALQDVNTLQTRSVMPVNISPGILDARGFFPQRGTLMPRVYFGLYHVVVALSPRLVGLLARQKTSTH